MIPHGLSHVAREGERDRDPHAEDYGDEHWVDGFEGGGGYDEGEDGWHSTPSPPKRSTPSRREWTRTATALGPELEFDKT